MSEQNILLGSTGDGNEIYATTISEPVVYANTSEVLRKVRISIVDKASNATIEEVDVYTSADAITFQNGLTLPEELDTRLQYSNMRPVPQTIGGIDKGSNFVNMKLQDLITQLLYPYVKPTFVSFTQSKSPSSYYEKGTDIAPITFTVNVEVGSENINIVGLEKDGNKIGAFENIATASGGIDSVEVDSVMEECTFRAYVTDAKGNTYTSNTATYRFIDPIYIGVVDESVTITENIVKGFQKFLTTSSAIASLNPQEHCMVIAYPSTFKPTSIKDPNGFEIISSFTELGNTKMYRADNTEVTYTWMKSDPTTQNGFKITVKS
ncbi:MAG: hypothetical protein IKA36_02050 [Clostridia bacterium]|nr:hypothetical protein [Clostridia bacterium]